MHYISDEQEEMMRENQSEALVRFVCSRLILENISEEEYRKLTDVFTQYRDLINYLWKHEVFPKPSWNEPESAGLAGMEVNIDEFIENTPLATLKISTYADYRLYLGTGVKTQKGELISTDYYLQIVSGNIYERYEFEGDESSSVSTKLKFAINFRMKYAYMDGDTKYIAYRIGKDRKDRIEEESQAIDTIRSLYHLAPKDLYNLKQYLDEIIPEFLKYDKPTDTRIAIIDGVIHVNSPYDFNEKEVLQALIDTRKVTTQKELMDFLSLYVPITPFNVELRKNELIMYFPLAMGKGGTGKSAMVKLITVKGFDNPDAEKSEDNIYTKASFRGEFSKSIFPIMIDEITQTTMMRIYGSMKNLATGSGKHSRGRPQGGLNEWTLTSIPIFTSNEMIYIDSGMERRFFKIIADNADNNIQEWRGAKANIPNGYQYLFLKELDGIRVSDMINEIVSQVETDDDYVYAYQMFIKKRMERVFERNGLKCPFEPVKKVVFDDDDWYEAFGTFVNENTDYALNGTSPYLKAGYDYEVSQDGYTYVTKLGFQKFLRVFSKCPFKTASTFAINAPITRYDIVYRKKRVCGSKNPIHVIGVREIGQEERVVRLDYNKSIEEQMQDKEKLP